MTTVVELPLDELHALAYVVERHRSRLPDAPSWERAAIAEQLRKTGLSLPDALTVALRAASDAGARTPAAIISSDYWAGIRAASGHRPARRPICGVCGRTQVNCEQAQQNTRTDLHPFRSQSGELCP